MDEIRGMLKQLIELLKAESWNEATKLAKQISALAEPNINRDKYQRVFNFTKAFAESYPAMKIYDLEKPRLATIYGHFKELHISNATSLEKYLAPEEKN
ncbi:MAG: hypothetical protein KF802_02560 [Bdellovibrionaceae bacterium]|nr:hypothetical protein [Pseudobdellovibrionaceae bacterium]